MCWLSRAGGTGWLLPTRISGRCPVRRSIRDFAFGSQLVAAARTQGMADEDVLDLVRGALLTRGQPQHDA